MKVTRSQIQDTHSDFSSIFLSIINRELAKSATNFLTFQDTGWYSDPFVYKCSIQYNLMPWSYLYLYFFGNFSGIDPRSKMAPLRASMIFVFLGCLGLRLTRISKRGVLGLSFVFIPIPVLLTCFVLFFLRRWPIAFWHLELISLVLEDD